MFIQWVISAIETSIETSVYLFAVGNVDRAWVLAGKVMTIYGYRNTLNGNGT